MIRARSRDPWIAALVGVTFLVVTHPWIYERGFGEPDSAAIAVGIHQAVFGGQGFQEPVLYLPSGHPLYYLAFLSWPGAADLERLVSVMNHVSWLSMGGAMALLYLICRRFTGMGWALAIVGGVTSSPIVFELATYGHPVTPALLLCLIGAELLLAEGARGFPTDARAVALLAASTTFIAASISTRADIVFFLPALLVLAIRLGPQRRAVVAAGLVICTAMVIFVVLRKLSTHGGGGPREGVVLALANFVSANYQLKLLRYGLAMFCLAAGLGVSLSLLVAAVHLMLRRRWSVLLQGACIILPTFAFFVCNPNPSRHFLHSILGIGIFLALVTGSLGPSPPKLAAALIPSALALNLGLLPLAGALARAAGWKPSPSQERRVLVEATQSVFERHRRNQRYLSWDRSRWERIWSAHPEGALFIGEWTDLSGLMLWSSAHGRRIRREIVPYRPDSTRVTLSIDGLTIHFWERYAGAPTRPPIDEYTGAFVLTPYPDEDLAQLPRSSLEATTWAATHRPL